MARSCAPEGFRRYRMVFAYDGAPYAGWQVQPGRVTIQGEMEAALKRITGQTARIHSCGRTDAGVHALGQTAHFDLPILGKKAENLPILGKSCEGEENQPGNDAPRLGKTEKGPVFHARGKYWKGRELAFALNAVLPETIRVLSIVRAKPDFHARYDALGKAYRYHLFAAPVMMPLERHRALHVPQALDLAAMREAAAMLEGTHDFAAFSANPRREIDGTVRTLHKLRVEKRGPLVMITATGDGFLYKMVRSLAGHLLRVGRGRIPAAETRAILESRCRTARVETAPPQGLVLLKVFYNRLPG